MLNKLENKKLEKEKGITLIALVITIIVLLILAGVSIAMLTGDNGILTQAKNAKNKTEEAQANEASDLANMESLINEYQSNINIPQVTDEKPGELEQEDANTLVINSIEDLVFFSNDVTKENNYEGKTVKLGVNLDFNSDKSYVNPNSTDYEKYGYNGPIKQALTTGEGFKPIGKTTEIANNEGENITEKYCFKGVFDGNGKVIRGLYINLVKEENMRVGLFSKNYGTIKNLGLEDVNIKFESKTKSSGVGGIVGINCKDVIQCYTTGNIKNVSAQWPATGGICGGLEDQGSILECHNIADITTENISNTGGAIAVAGGIVGQTSNGTNDVNKCYNKGNITAKNGSINVGGIIGSAQNEIRNCYNTGKVEGYSDVEILIGGISGNSGQDKNISNCYNIGNVKAVGNNKIQIGGIEGKNYANTITNVFNIGKVIVEGEDINNIFQIGGIAGGNWSADISNGYNIGNIDVSNNTSESVGSIIGIRWSSSITNCNYLKGTYEKGIGSFHSTSDTESGIKELKDISEFPNVLDVINEEGMFKQDIDNINNGYPIFK